MAKLSYKERKALPDDAFALSGRKYPIYDADHARAALARAKEMLDKNRLSKAEYDIVMRKANAVLSKEKSE